ncbi:hypothetical protein NECID01_0618 [Nematocida sp. AWRm77]|nr:hypothetical protein NECID01_0618 [Nematocida sp. AWRm77]
MKTVPYAFLVKRGALYTVLVGISVCAFLNQPGASSPNGYPAAPPRGPQSPYLNHDGTPLVKKKGIFGSIRKGIKHGMKGYKQAYKDSRKGRTSYKYNNNPYYAGRNGFSAQHPAGYGGGSPPVQNSFGNPGGQGQGAHTGSQSNMSPMGAQNNGSYLNTPSAPSLGASSAISGGVSAAGVSAAGVSAAGVPAVGVPHGVVSHGEVSHGEVPHGGMEGPVVNASAGGGGDGNIGQSDTPANTPKMAEKETANTMPSNGIDQANRVREALSLSLPDVNITDRIAAANVIGEYYSILLRKKNSIPDIRPITNILVYPVSNGEYTDYWGRIKFKKSEKGAIMDMSGFFQGTEVVTKSDILKKGQLTEIGFYQSTGLSKDESQQNYSTMRSLLQEISKETNKDIDALHYGNVSIKMLDGLVESFAQSQKKSNQKSSCLTVCVCQDSVCSLPCKSIKCIEPMYLI